MKTLAKKITVTSARPLSEKQMKKVEEVFSQKYSEPVDFDYLVDDSLIGGLMVFDGNTVFDGTVKTKLQEVKERLGNV